MTPRNLFDSNLNKLHAFIENKCKFSRSFSWQCVMLTHSHGVELVVPTLV